MGPFSINHHSLAWRLSQISQDGSDPVKAAITKALQASCTVYVFAHQGKWSGSGFHIGGGRLLTASHVCPPDLSKGPHEIHITFDEGRTMYPATIGASEPGVDVAVLLCKAALDLIPSLALGDSDNVQTGDQCAIISSPEGIPDIATAGRVSAVDRNLDDPTQPAWNNLIFVDADMLEGSSGGVVVNTSGEAIGLAMGTAGKYAEMGIGQHAVCPINKAKPLIG
jgi:S1-C subfamily serine protease